MAVAALCCAAQPERGQTLNQGDVRACLADLAWDSYVYFLYTGVRSRCTMLPRLLRAAAHINTNTINTYLLRPGTTASRQRRNQ